MKNVFHMNMMNLRNTAIKAYVPRGKEATRSGNVRKAANERIWRVVCDPSETINLKDATFGKMDLDFGARYGAWAKGTTFLNISSGLLYYYDHIHLKIRRIKNEQPTKSSQS